MATYEDIKKANETIVTMTIERKTKEGATVSKEYAEVFQRVKAFRMVYPDGFIITDIKSNDNGVCIFKASCGFYLENGDAQIIGTGTAFERENSSYINKTSYVENCETSAVGRALAMAGFGIDTSIASAEEVQNAIANQERKPEPKPEPRKATPKQVEVIRGYYGENELPKMLNHYGVTALEELTVNQASEVISTIRGRG